MYTLNDKIRNLVPYDPIAGEYKIRLDANESYFSMENELMERITYRDVTELFSKAFRDSQYTLSVILPTEAAD